jgi:uncharacterized protein (TIGR02271 family)
MPERQAGRVLGREGLRGTLLDPLPGKGNGGDQPVRVELDTGQVIDIPASMLRRHSPGTFEIPLGPADLDRPAGTASTSDEAVVPVLAEELHVGTRAVPTGGVRVHRRVYEHDEAVDIPLLKEHLDVRRVIIDREVEGPLPIRREGDTTIIPIVEEVLVLAKRFVLKEEVHVTRSVRQERHTERVTLKRQESEIERVDAEGRSAPVEVPADRPATKERARRSPRRSILGDT